MHYNNEFILQSNLEIILSKFYFSPEGANYLLYTSIFITMGRNSFLNILSCFSNDLISTLTIIVHGFSSNLLLCLSPSFVCNVERDLILKKSSHFLPINLSSSSFRKLLRHIHTSYTWLWTISNSQNLLSILFNIFYINNSYDTHFPQYAQLKVVQRGSSLA